ncbi:MAG TPA: hypothetical protein VEC12_05095, partial [Bacteroidia bacterium]|nr:hypothetical protein [Bacteroidia bacterium]
MLTKIFKILLWMLLWLFTGALLLLVIVRSETFQRWAIDTTTSYLSKELNTKVTVGSFRLQGLTLLSIDSIYIEDRQKDTLFHINEFTVNLDRLYFNFDDKEQKIRVRTATLDGATINFAKYSDTGEWNYQFFFDYFDKKDTTHTTKGPPFNLRIRNLKLQNSSFAMHNPGADTLPANKFNPSDFRFNHINATFERFSLVDDSLSFTSENFSTIEKHGFHIKNFTADSRIYSGGLEFYNLLIETEKSRLGNELKMNYTSWDDLNEFISTVAFDAKITKSEISMDDVAFWGPGMDDLHQVARLTGNIRGTIDNLKGREMSVEAGDESYLAGDFTIKGLPDFDASYIDVKFEKIHTYDKDVEALFGIDNLPEEVKKLGRIDFKGKFTGFPKAFVAYGNFTTELGKIYSDIKMDFSKGNQYATYSGVLKTDGFDLGRFTGADPTLGKITLDANVKGKGLTEETLDAEVKGKINAIYLNNYTYKNIDVDGFFAGKEFNGYLKIRDENLDLDFDGGVDLTTDTPAMNFVAHVRKANLLALGFDTVPAAVSGRMYINFTGNKLDNLNGDISLGRVVYARNARLVKLDTASLEAGYAGNERFIRLNSDIVSASITGHYNFSKLSGALYNYAATLLPKIVKADSVVQVREDFNFNINFKKPYVITNLLMDEISVDPFEASGSINTEKREISLNLSANSFTYQNLHFTGILLKTLPVENGVQRLELSLRDFIVGDSSYLRNSSVTLAFDSTNVLFDVNIPESITRLSARLKGQLLLSDEA